MSLTGKQKHYVRVGEAVDKKYNNGSAYSIAAWLHDYIEDGIIAVDELDTNIKKRFPNAGKSTIRKAKEAILLLTRDNQLTYREYIKKLCKNKVARTVKLYDLNDNMYNSPLPPPGDLKKRYEWAINYIIAYSERWTFPLMMIGMILTSFGIVGAVAYYIYTHLL